MAAVVLVLGHAALAVMCLIAGFVPERLRAGVVRAVATGGVGLGVALVVMRTSGEEWRTVRMEPAGAAVAGAAVACAWLVVAAMQVGTERWRVGCLVGVAGAGVACFATNRWLVPALVFWFCSSAAIAVLAMHSTSRASTWFGLVVSDALVGIAFLHQAVSADDWHLPTPMTGWPFWVVAAAAAVRVGVVPKIGVWGALASPAAPALPLLVGGGLAVATGPAARAEPWLAVAMVTVALVLVGVAVGGTKASLAAVAPWSVTLFLGIIWLTQEAAAAAGIAGVVAVTAYALWHESESRGRPGRALVMAAVPTTAGFAAMFVAVDVSFERAVAAGDAIALAPWAVTAALLPVALVGSVAVASRIGRGMWEEALEGRGPAVVEAAVGVLAAASLVAGLSPSDPLAFRWEPDVWLHVIAVLGGVWAAAEVWRRSSAARRPVVVVVEPRRVLGAREFRGWSARAMTWTAVVLGAGVTATVGWITVEGLRTGFL